MHDGQNLSMAPPPSFPEWIGTSATPLTISFSPVAVQPLIIVGFTTSEKFALMNTRPPKRRASWRPRRPLRKISYSGSNAVIHQEYRALPNPRLTGMGGSSLGGLLPSILD